jgi:uncharacterized protein (TIGR03435 family)
MPPRLPILGVALLLSVPCAAQNDHPLRFDAAVIKPYGRDPAMKTLMAPFTGGPCGKDPGHVSYGQVTLRTLLADAYGVRNVYDISGPRWLDGPYWAVTATYPPKTTIDQYRQMVKSLLVERFHLQAHAETKPVSGLELTVPPGGLKISPTTDSDFAIATPGVRPIDKDGFPLLRPDVSFAMGTNTAEDIIRMTFRQVTMSFLAGRLNYLVSGRGQGFRGGSGSAIFIDKTGLTDKFNFHLEVSGNADVGVSIAAISKAVEKQLGLGLHATKASVDRIVVDRVEPMPTPN